MFKFVIALSALLAVSVASPVVSGDYGSIGVQSEQTVRGALNTLSSYSKAINTAHSQAFVSRTDYTSNPGVVAAAYHAPIAPVAAAYHAPIATPYAAPYAAPIAAAYHAPYASPYAAAAYHAPYASPYAAAAYHAPIAAAYHAPAAYIH